MFEVNHNEASQGNSLMAEGEYEVIIKSATEDVTKGGTDYINIPLIIRNDIDQKYKNKYIFHSVWKVKAPKPADVACNGYSSISFQNISKAAKLDNGKKYASLKEWCDDLKGKLLRITVKHEEYQGKVSEKVKYTNETKFPTNNHVFKTEEAKQPEFNLF